MTKAEQDRMSMLQAAPSNYQTDAEREELAVLIAKRDAEHKIDDA